MTYLQDSEAIEKISLRAAKWLWWRGVPRNSFEMDITSVQLSDKPLDLSKLLDATDATFIHDVDGILYSMDRDNGFPGRIKGNFLPKCCRGEGA